MAVVNFKSAMPSVGGSSASAPASGSGSNTFRNFLIGLAVIGLGYWAYTRYVKSKQTADEDDN